MPLLEPTRILLIDNHSSFSYDFKHLLDNQADLYVCEHVFGATDALPTIQRINPHLVVLDVNLRGVNGIDLGRKIRIDFPNIRVIILTMYNQLKLVEEARQAGLHGYLLKDAIKHQLLQGIRAVLAGQLCFDLHLDKPVQTRNISFDNDFEQLFRFAFRETEVIRLIRDGLTTKQIADQLYIAPRTVKIHRRNIYSKLGISKVAELIQFANRNEL